MDDLKFHTIMAEEEGEELADVETCCTYRASHLLGFSQHMYMHLALMSKGEGI